MWVFSITVFVVGGISAVIGALMLKNKMVEALAGYDPNKVIDKEGLAKWAGSNLLLQGILSIAIGVFAFYFQIYYSITSSALSRSCSSLLRV